MKAGIMGGLLFGGLVAMALLGIRAGAVLVALGVVYGSCELVREKQAERAAESWRASYPPYGY